MMRNVLIIAVAMFLGYAVGWYQFSSSDNAEYAGTTSEVSRVTEDSKVAQQDDLRNIAAVADSETVSNAVDSLAKIDNINYTDLAGLVLSPTIEKVSDVIDNMTEPEIYLALGSVTSFDEQELKAIEKPSRFAKRLLSVALFREDYEQGDASLGTVEFGADVRSDNGIKEPATSFNRNMGRIYASFTLDEPVDQVFVKWFQNSPYKLKLFNKYAINREQKKNFIWYNPQDWDLGLYTVEVYALDSDLTKLASSSFRIKE